MKLTRDQELLRYSTEVWVNGVCHVTYDQTRYYREMPTGEMIEQRDKTVRNLERHPDFATKFYSEHVEYLNKKLADRKTLRDWLWRNIILKVDLALWTITTRIKKNI